MPEIKPNSSSDRTYSWLEWPMTVVAALLLAVVAWSEPGESREMLFMIFLAVVSSLLIAGIYSDWRSGALSHTPEAAGRGWESGAEPFARMRRRTPLQLVLVAMGLVGFWVR
jgi:hypothetical protein